MTLFPLFGLACYLALIFHFKSRGGYKPVQLAVAAGEIWAEAGKGATFYFTRKGENKS
jgi:hypothetical protein